MAGVRKSLPNIKDEVEYFQHQLDGIRKMMFMSSFILADDMGLGKSIQAATVAAVAFKLGETGRIMIISPASIKANWGEELDERARFDWEILDSKSKPARSKQIAAFNKQVLIVNYEQVVGHWEELNKVGFGIIIYDEAQAIKNHSSQRTKAAFKLRAPRHFLLTGTPIMNHVDDLWALLHRVVPREFPNYWTFLSRYAVYGGYQDKQIVGVKNEAELISRVNAYMIRRKVDECLDLPTIHITPVRLNMHAEQAKLYEQATEEMQIDGVGSADPMVIANAMVKLLRLKQICATTACIEGHPDFSTKLDWAIEQCQEFREKGTPPMIFTQFRGVATALTNRFAALKKPIPSFELNGGVKIPDRVPLVKEWGRLAEAGDARPIICSWAVAGVGLNMTAANNIITIDKTFVPAQHAQGYARARRIGQKYPVIVHELIMKNTIEQRIERILKTKTGLFGTLINQDDVSWKRKLLESLKDDEQEQ